MTKPRALILRSPGANCDEETQYAFELAGGLAERVHINRLRESPTLLKEFQIFVVPGGFTYGDDVASGRILANQLTQSLGEELRIFRDAEKLIRGICNSFQALLKAGLIIPSDEEGPQVTLTHNDSGKYEDRWTHVKVASRNCPFLEGYEVFHVPVAHAEGRIVCRESWILDGLHQSGQIALQYVDANGNAGDYPINPIGSQSNVAGLCDVTGRVLGLMPHPERHILPTHHPLWTREGLKDEGEGLQLFRNAVQYFL